MPARRVKTLFRNLLERNHREHRSKKGRHYVPGYPRILAFKRKKEKLKLQSLE